MCKGSDKKKKKKKNAKAPRCAGSGMTSHVDGRTEDAV
jgi:ribosomal protein S27AE